MQQLLHSFAFLFEIDMKSWDYSDMQFLVTLTLEKESSNIFLLTLLGLHGCL